MYFIAALMDATLEVKTLRMIKVNRGYKIGQVVSKEKIS